MSNSYIDHFNYYVLSVMKEQRSSLRKRYSNRGLRNDKEDPGKEKSEKKFRIQRSGPSSVRKQVTKNREIQIEVGTQLEIEFIRPPWCSKNKQSESFSSLYIFEGVLVGNRITSKCSGIMQCQGLNLELWHVKHESSDPFSHLPDLGFVFLFIFLDSFLLLL